MSQFNNINGTDDNDHDKRTFSKKTKSNII